MLLNAYINLLEDVSLFHSLDRTSLEQLLECTNADTQFYKKGSIVLEPNDPIDCLYIVASGILEEQTIDINGVAVSAAFYREGDFFGDINAAVGIIGGSQRLYAYEDAAVVLLNYQKLISPCSSACAGHNAIIRNLFSIMARKNLLQLRKMNILTKPTTREKILSFLEIQRELAGMDEFVIPYSRDGLSRYLCVDRSAMSRELSKMQNEGLIEFNKSRFKMIPQKNNGNGDELT